MARSRLVLVLLVLVLPSALCGADWPQWRGPQRDGVSRGAQLPKELPDKLAEPRWAVEIGEGYSSPAVVKGRLFILARPREGKEVCLCLDAATGERLWQHVYSCSYKPPDPRAGRGPSSTPTVDGDRVYMLGLGGMFHCLAVKDGRVLWKHDFVREYWGVKKDRDGCDAWFPMCGATASPLVVGDRVIVPVGGEKAGALTAFDRQTGKLVWKALNDRSSYGSPLLTTLPGGKQLVGFTGVRMVGLRFSDQTLLWEYPFPTRFDQTVLTPVLWNDRVIFGGDRKPLVALRLKDKDGKVESETAWENRDLRADLSTPVIVGGQLIGLDQNRNRLVSVDLETGKTLWAHGGLSTYASLVVVGDRLLVLSNDGLLRVLKPGPDRALEERKWRVAPGDTWAHLTVIGSRIYVKDAQRLLCYDLAGG